MNWLRCLLYGHPGWQSQQIVNRRTAYQLWGPGIVSRKVNGIWSDWTEPRCVRCGAHD